MANLSSRADRTAVGTDYLYVMKSDASVEGKASVSQMWDRANHTGTQTMSTVSDAGELATLNKDDVAAGTDNNQTGTTYTLVLTDADNKTVWMSNAAANTLTIPTNAAVAFPVGTKIMVMQEGAGATTVTGDTGVTVNGVSAGSKAVSAQYSGLLLSKRATDTWIVS